MSLHPGHGPARLDSKADDFKKAWKNLFDYMGNYRPVFVIALICAAISTILSLIGPDKMKEMTNLIAAPLMGAPEMDIDAIWGIVAFLAAIYIASSLLGLIQNYMIGTVSAKTSYNLRRDISQKINKLPLRYFDGSSTGDLMSRVTNDVDTIGQQINQSMSAMVSAIVMLMGSVIMMFYTNWVMALVALGSSLVGFALMGAITGMSQKYFAVQQKDLGLMNGHVAEIFGAHNVVRAYNGEVAAKERFDEINESLRRSGFRSQFFAGLMMPIMVFIGNFGYVMVCVVGALLVIEGNADIGTIVAFMIYIRLFTSPLSHLGQQLVSMQSVAAASERAFKFLGEDEMVPDGGTKKITDLKGEVMFDNVHFGYLPDKEVIHGFSASVKPGMKVAIVGPTGAGKTTMVNLLMRFYEVNTGDIKIDGVSTRDIKRSDVRNMFCMVLQDTWLFDGTIRDNIVYNRKNISDEEIMSACEAVGIDAYIESLPKGLDSELSGKGNLSQGQRQQIAIARAMVEGSPLLILDEATSSVDTRTERKIQEAMDRLTQGRTAFVIAHRLSTIKNSDMILVMQHGDIVEHGTHDELLAQNGFYAELYNSQFYEEPE